MFIDFFRCFFDLHIVKKGISNRSGTYRGYQPVTKWYDPQTVGRYSSSELIGYYLLYSHSRNGYIVSQRTELVTMAILITNPNCTPRPPGFQIAEPFVHHGFNKDHYQNLLLRTRIWLGFHIENPCIPCLRSGHPKLSPRLLKRPGFAVARKPCTPRAAVSSEGSGLSWTPVTWYHLCSQLIICLGHVLILKHTLMLAIRTKRESPKSQKRSPTKKSMQIFLISGLQL